MKMRFAGFLAFALLSISIISYGVNGSVFADSHNIPPLSASTELPTYGNGGKVLISGDIRDFDSSLHSGQALTYVIKAPDNNLVTIGQITPNSDGSFQTNFIAGGVLWKLNGDYTIEFHFGAISGETIIVYTGGDFTEPIPEPEPEPKCGAGTELVDGVCQVIKTDEPEENGGGGCLIATAAYGTELAPQIQFLREIRDNTVMSTASGTAFMTGFNQLYYSFSPTIADMERQNPMFQEAVRAFITPMVSTLSIMTLAEEGNEFEVFGLGASVIALNLGMYIAAPAAVGFAISKRLRN